MQSYLFDDIFEVVKCNPDGKKFDKGACDLALRRPLRCLHPQHCRHQDEEECLIDPARVARAAGWR